MPLSTIAEAIADVAAGRMVIVVDDEDRENEGDLTMAAAKVTPEAINFMARFGRGLICVPLTGQRLDELDLPLMVDQTHNSSSFGTAFTISVEARGRVTTGISAHDRAATIGALIDPATGPDDLQRPGHTFPLRAREGGVLRRAGQTEAAVDLARLAGLTPAGVICEIMDDDGTMARRPRLERVAAEHGLRIVSVAGLIAYRRRTESLIERVVAVPLPTRHGVFQAVAYANTLTGEQHLALVKGEIDPDRPLLVRMHSECLTGDVFGSLRCDCGDQLDLAQGRIAEEGGILVYMRQEGRGIGLHNKLRAYALQDTGLDTVEANRALGFPPDLRDYGVGAQILVDLGARRIRLLTNNPAKCVGLQQHGLDVVERVPLTVPANPHNVGYLATKRAKMGHLLAELAPAGHVEETHSERTDRHQRQADEEKA